MPKKESPIPSVETRIVEVGRELSRTFQGVLNALPGGPHRPQWLARSLGVNTVLTSRILKAAQQHDPLAVAHLIPGPEPLRRLLRAAEKKKIDPALIRDARAAVDRFQQLIDIEAGDRSALDAIISGWLPDAREKVELIAKQSVFRGASHLLGTTCDVIHSVMLLYPGGNDRADVLSILATRGFRRTRPGLVVEYDTVHATTPMLTITGHAVEDLNGLLLEQFCTKPLPQLQVTRHVGKDRTFAQYTLSGDDVGMQSAVNLVHATFLPQRKELHRAPGEPVRAASMAVGVGTPARTLVFDVLLHEDVYPRQEPVVNVYRTAGVFNRNEGGRGMDRLDVLESVQSLGKGAVKFRSTDTPEYQEMIRHACEQRQWDAGKFRGYRCRIEYPMYSSEIAMEFEVPPKPS